MSAKKGLHLTLKIWRQKNSKTKGQFETYKISEFLQIPHSWKCWIF